MKFIIGVSLCHFCEYHGPVVIMFTEAVSFEEFERIEKFFLDSSNKEEKKHKLCDGCIGFEDYDPGFISMEKCLKTNNIDVYKSSMNVSDARLRETINQSCNRSITSEYPSQQGPVVFVEEGAYSTFSYKFLLKDFYSRGFKRSYLINIVCSDKFHLINSWSFLIDSLEILITKIKADAENQFNKEHSFHNDVLAKKSIAKVKNDVHMKLIWKDKIFQRKQTRSLTEITNDYNIFRYMHVAFISLLKGMQLRISFNSCNKKTDGDFYIFEETAHSSTKAFKNKKFFRGSCIPNQDFSISFNSSIIKNIENDIEIFSHPRVLQKVLGAQNFNDLLHHLLVGHQVLVRAKEKKLLFSIIECLKFFLPSHAEKSITLFTDVYNIEHRDKLVVGMSLLPLLPCNLSECLVLDVSGVHMLKKIPFVIDCWIYKGHKKQVDELVLRYYMITLEKLDVFYQVESFLEAVQLILQNENLESSLGDFCLYSLKQDWIDKAKIFNAYSRWNNQESEVLQVIGTQKKDEKFLKYWAKNFCSL